MSYRVPLPSGGRLGELDLIEPHATAVQRSVHRHGLGGYEPPTSAAILATCEGLGNGFVFFDVGANMGLYGALSAALFSPRVVHAFEPAPTTAEVARRIARQNRLQIQVHELALSDMSGTAKLHMSPVSDASNSLVEGFRETDVRLEVAVATLDDFVEQTGDHPDLIKIDVETHERAVLDGARSTIETCRPIIIVEVLHRRGRDHGEEITEFLDGLGYRGVELSESPAWVPLDTVKGSGTVNRDWLLFPGEIPDGFGARWQVWNERLAACGADRNPVLSMGQRARAAYRRGGVSEVVAAASRFRRGR